MEDGTRCKSPRVANRRHRDTPARTEVPASKGADLPVPEIPRRRALDFPIRPTRAEIDLVALTRNVSAIRALAPRAQILAVVKANAYGHGAVPIAQALESERVKMLGVALIEGYESLEFETSLSKPFLRKELELRLKAICEGRISRAEVMQESLRQYKSVFMESKERVELLKAVRHALFPPTAERHC